MVIKKAILYSTLAGLVAGGAATAGQHALWALDVRYWNVSEQLDYEKRQLIREVKKAELNCIETQSPTDCAYYEFLKGQLEDLGA